MGYIMDLRAYVGHRPLIQADRPAAGGLEKVPAVFGRPSAEVKYS